jgi:thiol-disulfide isomerase/thioredoxin
MSETPKRMLITLDRAANLATVIACLAVCFAVGRQYVWPRTAPPPPSGPAAPYNSGERLQELSKVNFRAAPETVVLFVKSTCHFCELSMPFYQALSDSALRKNGTFRFVVASSDAPAVTRDYLAQYKVGVDEIVSVTPGKTKVHGTPTLLLVDRNATVVSAWIGLLQKDGQQEVLQQLARRRT